MDIVIKILVFNNQNQEGQGLTILISDEMLSGLPITLTLLKAGSEKFKNEIRKLLYFSYSSKTSTKTIYNNLINSI